MKLKTLRVEGFRRIANAVISFGDATFLIGANNAGKSTVLRAVQTLLSVDKKLVQADYYCETDPVSGRQEVVAKQVRLEATFRDLPLEAATWRGFKGRIRNYNTEDCPQESGLEITYRKTFTPNADVVIEMLSRSRTLKAQFSTAVTPQALINAGADSAAVNAAFDDLNKKFKVADLVQIDELWDFGDADEWIANPGGIPQNVLARLPRVILIPADSSDHEIDGDKGVMNQILKELFETVREGSAHYEAAKSALALLAAELDPEDSNSEFGMMMMELNRVVTGVFPDSRIFAKTDLSGPGALKPSFAVTMESNIRTAVSYQGTGSIRSAAFGVLRYRQNWIQKRADDSRTLIICFEEPELYLHPSAATQMRDLVYELSGGGSQIVCTSHSPYMIDLTQKPKQVVNRLVLGPGGLDSSTFNVSEKLVELEDDDKDHVKMVLRVDDQFARVFFTKHVIVIEGDTEDLVIRESVRRLDREARMKIKSQFEIVKARGKSSIIGVCRYLHCFGIIPTVMHDRDGGVAGAEKFNKPIEAAAAPGKVIVLEECVENCLGYDDPGREKPFVASQTLTRLGSAYHDLPVLWRAKMTELFGDLVPPV